MTDIEIARSINPKDITEVAKTLGIENKIELYGSNKAKISLDLLDKKRNSKLVLVTAINPTPMGEGKTTVSISLNDALRKLGKKSILTLREPSLGPVFGVKGGATGGGYAQVIPMEDINLHFTGDFHAITTANNLLCSVIDNHIYQGNTLNIDKVIFKRCLDLNDRQLRVINTGLSKEKNTKERIDGFDITAASEIMAILCLSKDLNDLKRRLGNIVIGYDNKGKEITARMLKADGAMTVLLKDAIKPNLVQTLEGNPCIIHGGPFANIAHGCNSIIATKMALKLADVVVTEAGFGADLGAEKFLDIKCQEASLNPSLVVMVATIRALKMHGKQDINDLEKENIEALKKGTDNLKQHLENIQKFGLNVVVAINHFATDTENEINFLKNWCKENNYKVSFLDGYLLGADGSKELSYLVKEELQKESHFQPLYSINMPTKEKIEKICKEIYRADDVEFSKEAEEDLKKYHALGFDHTYICMAKTPNSFSDDPLLLNTPRGFKIHIRKVNLSSGANFLIPLTGNILTLPGLPKVPQAVKMENE